MQKLQERIVNTYDNSDKLSLVHPAERIVAMWALSEAALGGVLHALRLPFTGLFVGSMSVIFITMLSVFDSASPKILRATLLVMIVKILISPHAPINAYAAIAFQGILGAFLFSFIKNTRTAAMFLGILSLIQSAFQKLLIITLVFGINFWEATNVFSDYILGQIPYLGKISQHVSFVALLTGLYISLHLIAGIGAGYWAPRISRKLKNELENKQQFSPNQIYSIERNELKPKKRKRTGKRLTYIAVLIISFVIFVLSYIVPVFEESLGLSALVMVFRSIIIIALWYYLLGPWLMRRLRNFLEKKEFHYHDQVDDILNTLPKLRQIVVQCWKDTDPIKNPRLFPYFIQSAFLTILTADL